MRARKHSATSVVLERHPNEASLVKLSYALGGSSARCQQANFAWRGVRHPEIEQAALPQKPAGLTRPSLSPPPLEWPLVRKPEQHEEDSEDRGRGARK